MGGLGLVLGVEVLFLVWQAIQPSPVIEAPVAVMVAPSTAPPAFTKAMGVEPLPSLAQSAPRPMFVSSTPAAPVPSASPPPGSGEPDPAVAAKALAARLTLRGIVAGDPAQAIIEDVQTKKTYFVSRGQTVVDGATVQDVLETRVVLTLDGETIELAL